MYILVNFGHFETRNLRLLFLKPSGSSVKDLLPIVIVSKNGISFKTKSIMLIPQLSPQLMVFNFLHSDRFHFEILFIMFDAILIDSTLKSNACVTKEMSFSLLSFLKYSSTCVACLITRCSTSEKEEFHSNSTEEGISNTRQIK